MFREGAKIAIVDDDDSVRRSLRRLVLSMSLDPLTYESGQRFINSLSSETPECVLLDLNMPGMSGEEVFIKMKDLGATFPVIIMTGFDQPGMEEKFLRAGTTGYLPKPISRNELMAAFDAASRA